MSLRGPLGGLTLIIIGLAAVIGFGLRTQITCSRAPGERVACVAQRSWFGVLPLGSQSTYTGLRSAEAVGAVRIVAQVEQTQVFGGFSSAGAERAA